MGALVEIKCICCGRLRLFEEEEDKIIAWICHDCLEKIKQESELRKASAELS